MESSSKLAANILIVCAILLIGTSLFTVLTKKQEVAKVVAVATTTPPAPVDIPQDTVSTSTPENSTTTEEITNSTSTTTTTATSTKNALVKSWTWSKTTMKSTSTIPKKLNAFTLTFKADGSLSGTTDCNTFFGNYKIASTTLSFSQLGSTKMYCEGAQEGDFMATLQEVKSFLIDKSNNLTLTTTSGSMMFK